MDLSWILWSVKYAQGLVCQLFFHRLYEDIYRADLMFVGHLNSALNFLWIRVPWIQCNYSRLGVLI